MVVNGTILAQMVHFFIAYGVLKEFLFKPAVAMINNEDRVAQETKKLLAARNDRVVYLQQMRAQAWKQCHNYYLTHCPEGFHERNQYGPETTKMFKPFVTRSIDSKKLVEPVAQQLADRILHDYV